MIQRIEGDNIEEIVIKKSPTKNGRKLNSGGNNSSSKSQ